MSRDEFPPSDCNLNKNRREMNNENNKDHILKSDGLVKEYKTGSTQLTVLKKIDIEVRAGEFITIVGSSGAGKSTLLHILGALDRPTRGTVQYNGDDLYKLSDSRRAQIRNKNFGFVFQFYHLMPEFTALENVMLPGMIAGNPIRKLKKTALDLLDAVEISERAKHFPNQLSGGEQQRVAIARSLLNRPDILFADEPTGNLDEDSSSTVINVLKNLQNELSFALIMVTHNAEISQLGTTKLRIKDGTLITN